MAWRRGGGDRSQCLFCVVQKGGNMARGITLCLDSRAVLGPGALWPRLCNGHCPALWLSSHNRLSVRPWTSHFNLSGFSFSVLSTIYNIELVSLVAISVKCGWPRIIHHHGGALQHSCLLQDVGERLPSTPFPSSLNSAFLLEVINCGLWFASKGFLFFYKFKVHFHVFLCLGEQVTAFLKESSTSSEDTKIQKGHKLMISWRLFLVVPLRTCCDF